MNISLVTNTLWQDAYTELLAPEAQKHGKGGDHAHLWVVSISTSSLSYLRYYRFPGLFYPVVNKLQGVNFRPWLCTESAGDMEVSNNGQGH